LINRPKSATEVSRKLLFASFHDAHPGFPERKVMHDISRTGPTAIRAGNEEGE
jgi:hypothetical protein